MTRYETSPEVRPLEKTICEFAGLNGYDPMNVFTDFLRYVIHGFSPGAPPLKDWRYKRQQNAAFMKMFAEWVRLMQKQLEAASWYDALGDLFMALSSRKGQQAQGQFFTPVHICDLMVMCTETDEKKTGQRINDPTCGSGRLLLAYHVRHLGNYLVADKSSGLCCKIKLSFRHFICSIYSLSPGAVSVNPYFSFAYCTVSERECGFATIVFSTFFLLYLSVLFLY